MELDEDGNEADRAKIVIYDLSKGKREGEGVRFTITQGWDRSVGEVAVSFFPFLSFPSFLPFLSPRLAFLSLRIESYSIPDMIPSTVQHRRLHPLLHSRRPRPNQDLRPPRPPNSAPLINPPLPLPRILRAASHHRDGSGGRYPSSPEQQAFVYEE